MPEWRIPLADVDLGPEEEAAVLRVLRSRWLSMGPEVEAFEREFARMLAVDHAIAVANGTAALHLALRALALQAGDEVVQPALNFVAAANMTLAVGARPVFADIVGLSEPSVDPEDLERRITARTKAVVVMHYGGYLCRMEPIVRLCRDRGLVLVEDASHAVGAHWLSGAGPGRAAAGTMGDVGCFSFFSNKNLTTGEGGMIVTRRDDLAECLRRLRSHGMTTSTWDRHRGHASSYDVIAPGFNYRLDELRAAIGRVQLQDLERNNRRRETVVAAYRRRFAPRPDWIVPFASYAGESAHHLMTVVAPDEPTRQQTVEALRRERIQTSLHYPCVADFSAFRTLEAPALEHSRSFARRMITLPLSPGMTEQQVAEICGVIL
ncbi:MAG TPA: DegT/DnrJ/EryC1/StrS aminotransferase family protein [Candidatus Methylomirabilis sp.]|nr:DegT/DnrJ/EryC1/StrS aminotransferase family protein [Candidatus Methylomirabilis sp.]